MKIKTCLASICCVVALSATARSAVVGGWDFSDQVGGVDNFGPSPLAADTTLANVTVGGLTRGSGIATAGVGGSGSANAWGGTGFITASPSLASAITANEFVTLSLTAAAGYQLSLSDIGAYNVRRSGTGPTSGQWQYQIGSSAFNNIGGTITWGTTTSASGNAQSLISLTGISALQGVAPNTTVTLRLVLWGATNAGGTWYLNDPADTIANDFTINGTVAAIPEPGAYMFGLLATTLVGVGCGGRYLWKKRSTEEVVAA